MLHLDRLDSFAAQVLLSVAVMMISGFLLTRVTKRLKLPNVTGYILAGILIGPYLLDLIPRAIPENMDFVTDIALAFIAFDVGRYFKLSKLRETGWRVIVITLFEALTASLLVTLVMRFCFGLSLAFSLLLGAIASATAPASTIMTIRQYHAKGPFVNTLLEVAALDDAVALISFSACVAFLSASEGGVVSLESALEPVFWNLLVLAGGALGGWILRKLADVSTRSDDHRMVLVICCLLAISGLCAVLEVSPLLACMAMGAVYINCGGQKQTFYQISKVSPPILLLFFVLSGYHLNVPMLASAGLIGIIYFLVRILGKYAGAWLGAGICRSSPEIRAYLGLALIPQAGVSIGLAFLAQRILPADTGQLLSTIILSSGVLYELIGPACAKAALRLSHSLDHPEPAKKQEES